jgi:nucleoside-diphosphate-sugar epimerase
MIFLSSVAVYGEDDRPLPVSVDATPRPATEYGHSKLVCEKMVSNSHLTKCDILRMAPVYDNKHLQDVSKRVYFPGLRGIKMRIFPQPYYSLCHVNLVGDVIQKCILRSCFGGRILHVADHDPYSQHELVKWFKGITIPFPMIFARPLYLLGRMIPGAKGYAIRCLFSKLFLSNTYVV